MKPGTGKDLACVRNRGRPVLPRQSQLGEGGLWGRAVVRVKDTEWCEHHSEGVRAIHSVMFS